MVHYAIAHGLTLDEIVARTDLERVDLLDPESRVSDNVPSQLWELIRPLAGEGPQALHMARATNFSIFGPWFYPLRFAPDLRTALSTMERYQEVLSDQVQLTESQEGDEVRFQAAHPNDEADGGITNELGLAMTWRLIDEVLGCGEAVARVELRRADDEFVQLYEAFFTKPVRLGSPQNAFVFHLAALDQPTRESDQALFEYACGHLELLGRRFNLLQPPDPLAPVKIAVSESLAAGAVGVDAVAAEINMSARSLQRFVKEHGTTVKSIIEQVRATQAREMVSRSDLDFVTIAQQLGYSDDRSFRRAFRRWTGHSPASFRELEHRAE